MDAQLAAFAVDCLPFASRKDMKNVHLRTISHKIRARACARKAYGRRWTLLHAAGFMSAFPPKAEIGRAIYEYAP
jgi:hypothetical protein